VGLRRAMITVLCALWAVPMSASAQPEQARVPTLVIANVEVVDLAPRNQRYDQAEDAARAAMLSERIRSAVSASPAYRLLDRGPADREPPHRYHSCRACIVDWARERGADRVLVTWVQKVSRLIQNINMVVIDVSQPDRARKLGSVSLRGDIDAVWLAGARQLLDEVLTVKMSL